MRRHVEDGFKPGSLPIQLLTKRFDVELAAIDLRRGVFVRERRRDREVTVDEIEARDLVAVGVQTAKSRLVTDLLFDELDDTERLIAVGQRRLVTRSSSRLRLPLTRKDHIWTAALRVLLKIMRTHIFTTAASEQVLRE